MSEINEKGEIAKLTCVKPPEPPASETVDEDEDLLLSKYNLEILPMETWDSINKLVLSKESTENIEVSRFFFQLACRMINMNLSFKKPLSLM